MSSTRDLNNFQLCWKFKNNVNTFADENAKIRENKSKHSCFSMKTRIDSSEYLELSSLFPNSNVRFFDTNGFIINSDGTKYLAFKFDDEQKDANQMQLSINDQLRLIPKFMSGIWNLDNPKIIIPIITGLNFKNWKNKKLEEQFKRGITKAANKTETWFLTNGINGGISQMVGEAFNEERASRLTETSQLIHDSKLDLKPLVLIGIVSASRLQNYSSFDGTESYLKLAGNRTNGKLQRFDLNTDHSHAIIFDDTSLQNEDQPSYDIFRNRLEFLFTKSLSYYRRRASCPKNELSDDESELSKSKSVNHQIPMVCLAIRGDLNSIDSIDFKITKEIPVVILKGSGGAADIIAFAYDHINENKDQDYEDDFIKPEVSKKLLEEFKEELSGNDIMRNAFRDKVLSIVKNGSIGTQKFITLVDMKSQSFDFSDIDKYILTALLQSQIQFLGKSGKTQLDRNLRLTLDWNFEDLALSEIFQRDDYTQIDIKHSIFELAILRKDREKFVELFLDQGFCLHRYLGHNNIRDLFNKAENRDFFITVILHGILGHYTSELPDDFLPDGLNLVLKKLTSMNNLVNILEIYMNQLGFYVTNAKYAEKKALNFLIIYSILMDRHKLAKILWKRTEEPIPVALICSMIYRNLVTYCQESYLKTKLETYQKDFADLAVGVLNLSFSENDPRSYSVFNEKYADWNLSNALELAYNSKNRDFIAHPCCQKILTKRLFGHIQVRENSRSDWIDWPTWIKVILSAFFVIPMYFWIIFPQNNESIDTQSIQVDDASEDGNEKDEAKEEEELTKAELNSKLTMKMRRHKLRNEIFMMTKDNLSFYKKIYLLWTAPYTKFWLNFVSYICFLMLFGLVTIWPCCGNLILDSILWFWTASIVIEDIRITYNKYFTGSQLPLRSHFIEIFIMIVFLILFLAFRIIGVWDYQYLFHDFAGFDRIYLSKSLLCIYLLFFYYRTVFIFLPISHKLGPMLVRMKLMVSNDFLTYLRLFFIFMTAGAISLNAILYPFYPIDYDLLKRVFVYRGFMQLFALDKLDLERINPDCAAQTLPPINLQCTNVTEDLSFHYRTEKLETSGIWQKCNHLSIIAWFILIQYYLLVKLFLPTLLTAMFSATGQRVSSQSEQIWMNQRYEIIIDYETRLTFPPPFTFISYIILFIQWVYYKITKSIYNCKEYYIRFHRKKYDAEAFSSDDDADLKSQKDVNLIKPTTINVYSYWRNYAQKYVKEMENEYKESTKIKSLESGLSRVREDLSTQQKSIKRLNDRVLSIEKSIKQNQSYLETIKNILTQKSSKSGLLDRKKSTFIHILARESPYIFTNIPRFFVYEKLVPWECTYDIYDPQHLSIDPEGVDKIYVDEEPNKPKDTIDSSGELVKTHVSDSQIDPSIAIKLNQSLNEISFNRGSQQLTKKSNFLWNSTMTSELSSGKAITIDRKSWITKLNEQTGQFYPVIYSLDSVGLPKNPMGRTGMRGRGSLLRYGPNHEIMAIVTRWKKLKNKPIYIDRRKLLEFISCKDLQTGLIRIPGDKLLGDESKYSVICRTFMELVFEETSVERCLNFTQNDMSYFFASFASSQQQLNQENQDLFNELNFSTTLVYSGYLDDPRNTDNAWVECEIWNFHYDKDDYFDKRIPNSLGKWRELNSSVRINSNEIINDVLKEIAETLNAHYN